MRKKLLAAFVAALPVLAMADPTVVTHPGGATVCGGSPAYFRTEGAGTGPITYQWEKETPGVPGEWSIIDEVVAPGDLRTRYLYIYNPDGSVSLRVVVWTLDAITRYRCLVSDAFGTVASNAALLTVLSADVGTQGGVRGPDGELDNNDFIVFIDGFFSGQPWADLGTQSGMALPDGQFDNNDFIVFIDLFFNGCYELHEPSPPPPTPLLPDPGLDP